MSADADDELYIVQACKRRNRQRALDPRVAGEADPEDYETFIYGRRTVVTPMFVRGRIRDATLQMHAIVMERVKGAKRPYDLATEDMLISGVRALADARKHGEEGDRRAARLSLAATLILLAEQDDRPPAPARGQRRAEARPLALLGRDLAA